MLLKQLRILRKFLAKLPGRIRRRLWRILSGYLPPRGRLPRDWSHSIATSIGTDSWKSHFARDRGAPWLWSRDDRKAIADWIRTSDFGLIHAVTRRADVILNRKVEILGYGEVALPSPMDWSLDPVSRISFPAVRTERVPLILPDRSSDMKHVWEPARFHFAPTLGAAYALTEDERYAHTYCDWIIDFIEKNPYRQGIQWTNPMEAAIRVLNWMVGWQWCADAKCVTEEFTRTWVGSLIQHGEFISANLECSRRGINTNHYIADLIGLYALAVFLPEWPQSERWRTMAKRELLAEAKTQILPDGFCYESSFGYQRLTFEMWFFFWRLASLQREEGLEPLADALRGMATFSSWNADGKGHLPAFGDGDDGRFVFWESCNPADHTPVWTSVEAALGTADIRSEHRRPAVVPEDILWLLGVDPYERLIEQYQSGGATPSADPNSRSRLFPDAQIAVLRSNRWLIHAFANPVGSGGIGGHKHNDMLSFTAACDGIPVVIDPGTYAYSTDPALRTRMRRTEAHATVVVDRVEQNRFMPGQLFCLWQDARPDIVAFADDGTQVRLVMRHDGYRRLRNGVVMERELVLDRVHETLVVTDRILGSGRHHIDVVLPLGQLPVRLTGASTAEIGTDKSILATLALRGPQRFAGSVVPGWRSSAYGVKEGHRRLVFSADVKAPAEWSFALSAKMPLPEKDRHEHRCEQTTPAVATGRLRPLGIGASR